MGVYIKGMEMPKYIEPGLTIEFADGIDGKRYARLYHYRHGGLTEWLEAVPVPPHGRLIDADAAEKKVNDLFVESLGKILCLKLLEWMPTVIPADGKDIKVPTGEEEV